MTDTGAVRGTRTGAVLAFKGVPYAAPPIGGLRFRSPVMPDCWDGIRDATAFGNVCPQLDNAGTLFGDEDCLTLNVWTPDTAASAPLPVLFFIHGGGNTQGTAAMPLYDGSYLAEHGPSVVVTINYRLGALGFLAHPALDAESEHGVSGNYGILDQIAALGWVQRNIGGFGGDPARVLLFGESAGATDVCVLLASPRAAGLFSRALMESGACNQRPLAVAEQGGVQVVQATGCDSAADVASCLRNLPVTVIAHARSVPISVSTLGSLAFGPNVDGYVLTGSPLDVIRTGAHNRVPFIVGANADETAGLGPPPIADGAAFREAIARLIGSSAADAVLQQYPAAAYGSPRLAYIAATTDADFVCPARAFARAAVAASDSPVYRYFFTHRLDSGAGRVLGAFHGLELAFVFHTLGATAGYVPSAGEVALADAMVGYWTRFAASGDPNGGNAPAWPAYDAAADAYLQIDTALRAGQELRTDNCNFWARLAAASR